MSTQENPYAGQGPVLLDIGGDVGALVVTMPAELEGVEVEIRPIAEQPPAPEPAEGPAHSHHAGGAHHHTPHLPHVAVVPRHVSGILVHSLVFPELKEGRYELYQRPGGAVELTVSVVGGEVAEAVWPHAAPGPAH